MAATRVRARRAARVAISLLAAAAGAALPAAARREPVLRQIRLPHPYYYREMFLPQATSGPSSASWSPDGSELVVSMQGSLWRLRPETGVAVQLTDGPGYDYQPDWSPDGRTIVYASYRDDAIELRLLDAVTGATRPLVANGAVNVEPRFSPDGSRLAYVSTAYEGRFHVFLLSLGAGDPGDPERLTEDHDSGLPRYYYSVFDHYLSPSWSPDGSEIILVSNRGHVWGSGGIFRMKTRRGAKMREIRSEETTWKARPDWSPDGRRVAYSSYLGGQWNQVWLMTDEGGDPFPIGYGNYDSTAPRWSRDGRRIAFITNEGGDTSLVIQEIPGGARRRVAIRERRRLRPSGRLRVEILGPDGRPLPARVSVTVPDGRAFAPDDAWRHADDSFDRAARTIEYGYFHTPGASELTVPAGTVSVEVSRGLEYRVERRAIEVPPGGTVTARFRARRLIDLPARGWWSGDLHVHMNYGGTYRNDPRHLALQARAEDLHVVENLIVNKEQRIPDIAFFSTVPDPVSTRELIIAPGQEYHTSYWGHTALLAPGDHFLLPAYAGYVNTAAASLEPTNAAIFDLAHAQGATTGYVHPYDAPPDPSDGATPLHHELPVDVALGKMDYLEVVGFSDHLATAAVWYRLLNCGFRIPAGAGTDAMANFASLRGPVGMNRVFVEAGKSLDHRRFLAALRAGRSFATNGPIVMFDLGGRGPGDEIRLPPGRRIVPARVTLRSIVPVDHLEIVGNGRVVADLPLTGDRTAADLSANLTIEGSGWYTLRAWSAESRHPVLDIYPFATTSPVYVRCGAEPVRSASDARWFLSWIDRLIADAGADPGYNNAREKEDVLRTLRAGRAVYAEMSGD
jgi:TolB protein